MADPPAEATVIQGGDGPAMRAAGVVQGIGEVESSAKSGNGLLEAGAILGRDAGMLEELVQHLRHLFPREAAIAPQSPLQFQEDCLGQIQPLA